MSMFRSERTTVVTDRAQLDAALKTSDRVIVEGDADLLNYALGFVDRDAQDRADLTFTMKVEAVSDCALQDKEGDSFQNLGSSTIVHRPDFAKHSIPLEGADGAAVEHRAATKLHVAADSLLLGADAPSSRFSGSRLWKSSTVVGLILGSVIALVSFERLMLSASRNLPSSIEQPSPLSPPLEGQVDSGERGAIRRLDAIEGRETRERLEAGARQENAQLQTQAPHNGLPQATLHAGEQSSAQPSSPTLPTKPEKLGETGTSQSVVASAVQALAWPVVSVVAILCLFLIAMTAIRANRDVEISWKVTEKVTGRVIITKQKTSAPRKKAA